MYCNHSSAVGYPARRGPLPTSMEAHVVYSPLLSFVRMADRSMGVLITCGQDNQALVTGRGAGSGWRLGHHCSRLHSPN